MKKFLFSFLIGAITLTAFNSCTKEYNTYETVPSITMVYERNANQWQTFSSKDKYLDLSVPELTNYYVRQGIVGLAISFDGENTYNTIPATIEGIAYSFDYTSGSVRIYAQDPIYDDNVTITVPANIFIKVSLTEADFVE